MGRYLRGSDDAGKRQKPVISASQFAQAVLAGVGGSQVYIEPKKVDKKFIDVEAVE